MHIELCFHNPCVSVVHLWLVAVAWTLPMLASVLCVVFRLTKAKHARSWVERRSCLHHPTPIIPRRPENSISGSLQGRKKDDVQAKLGKASWHWGIDLVQASYMLMVPANMVAQSGTQTILLILNDFDGNMTVRSEPNSLDFREDHRQSDFNFWSCSQSHDKSTG